MQPTALVRRVSLVSVARYTSPMPPAPTNESITYGPSWVPGARDMGARQSVEGTGKEGKVLGSYGGPHAGHHSGRRQSQC